MSDIEQNKISPAGEGLKHIVNSGKREAIILKDETIDNVQQIWDLTKSVSFMMFMPAFLDMARVNPQKKDRSVYILGQGMRTAIMLIAAAALAGTGLAYSDGSLLHATAGTLLKLEAGFAAGNLVDWAGLGLAFLGYRNIDKRSR